MKPITTINSKLAVIDIKNIDTDQIIGSDFLKITDKKGLGKHLFSDWRYDKSGRDKPDFVLNKNGTRQSKVLVVGDNFGCGSSREHAPWALLDFGIQVVISSSIADIFSNNSIKNGLLPIAVSSEQHQFLLSKNGETIEVDLVEKRISCAQQSFEFKIEAFARYCLNKGVDQLDFLIQNENKIDNFEKNRKVFQ